MLSRLLSVVTRTSPEAPRVCIPDVSALHDAIRRADLEQVKHILVHAPILVDQTDSEGYTALHWAASCGALAYPDGAGGHQVAGDVSPMAQRQQANLEADYEAIVRVLIQHHASTEVRSAQDETPLHLAVRLAGSMRLASALLRAGSDRHAQEERGNTALHWAVLSPVEPLALSELLLAAGDPALMALRNHAGQTARDLVAARPAHHDVPLLLALLDSNPGMPVAALQPMSPAPRQPWRASLQLLATQLPALEAKLAHMPEVRAKAAIKDAWRLLELVLTDWNPDQQHAPSDDIHCVLDCFARVAVLPGPVSIKPARLQRMGEWVKAADNLPAESQSRHLPERIALYCAVSRQWRRAGSAIEAIAYASYAYRLAQPAGSSDADEALAQAERTAILAQLQRAASNQAGDATGEEAAENTDLAKKNVDYAGMLLATLTIPLQPPALTNEAVRPWIAQLAQMAHVLEQARRAYQVLSGAGLTEQAYPWLHLWLQLGLDDVAKPLKLALNWARQQPTGEPFAELARTTLRLAEVAVWHGAVGQAKGWCNKVLDARKEVRTTVDAKACDYDPVLALKQSLGQLNDVEIQLGMGQPPVPGWRRWRERLAALRREFADGLDSVPRLASDEVALTGAALPIETLQRQWTQGVRTLLSDILTTCQGWMLIDPPCAFAVVGLGSISRQDMAPYSDLEYVILVEGDGPVGPLAAGYFDQLAQLFSCAILSLGETPVTPLPLPSGLRIDPRVALTIKSDSLINTVPGMIDAVFKGNGGNGDLDIAYSMLSPRLIYGSDALLRTYFTAVKLPGNGEVAAGGADRCQRSALAQLRVDVAKLPALRSRWDHALAPDARIDLKHDIIGPLNHALTTLAMIYRFTVREPAAVLAELAASQYLASPFVADYRWALATLQAMRCRHHLRIGEQQEAETIVWQDLGDDERADLQAIAQRVAQPLWTLLMDTLARITAQEGHDALLRHLWTWHRRDPALENLYAYAPASAPHDAAPDQRPIRADLTDAMVRSAAATLAHRQAATAVCLQTFQRVMGATSPGQYWQCWSIWRDAFGCEPQMAATLSELRQDPRPDGWRAAWEENQRLFYRRLSEWLEPVDDRRAAAPGEIRVRALDLDLGATNGHGAREYRLAPAIAAQLLVGGALIREKRTDVGGRHVVVPIRFVSHAARGDTGVADAGQPEHLTWWVKLAPESPATERLVHALDCRLGGGLDTPMSLLVTLKTGAETVAAQIMTEVRGANLQTVLETEPQRLARLDRASLTRTLLRVLLINPEDDRGDDYRLGTQADGSEHLGRLDNERAFFAIEKTGKFGLGATLQVKSQLYCLDQMAEPLDADVLADFVRREPLQLLRSWIDEAVWLQAYYRSLLTEDMVIGHYRRQQSSFLVVGMSDRLEHELHSRLELMQDVIRAAPKGAPARDGLTLLHTVQPKLWEHYQRAFLRHPSDGDNRQAWARFHWLTDGEFSRDQRGQMVSAMRGNVAVSRSLGTSKLLSEKQVRAIWYGDSLSPAQARERLQQLELHQVSEAVEAVCAGEPGAEERFRRLGMRQRALALQIGGERQSAAGGNASTSDATEAAQRRLLSALAGTHFANLSLGAFGQVLTDDLLIPLLAGMHAHLCVLDLRGCWRLTASSLVAMAENCPNLAVLKLNQLAAPAELADVPLPALRKPTLSFGVLTFPRLHQLDVRDNPRLTAIDIQAPRLLQLTIDGCRALRAVRTGSTALRELSMRDCTGLDEGALTPITDAWQCMERIELSGCTQLQHLAFRQRFPWVADYGWNAWAGSGLADVAHGLAQGRDDAIVLPAIEARVRVREWFRARTAAVDALVEGSRYTMGTALLEGIRDKSHAELVYDASVVALGNIGAEWREPVFAMLLRDLTLGYVPSTSAPEAIGRIGIAHPAKVLATLLPMLSPPPAPRLAKVQRHLLGSGADDGVDHFVPRRTIHALARMGATHPELVIAALKEARRQGDPVVRQNATAALAELSATQTDRIVGVFLRALDYDWGGATKAATALIEGRFDAEMVTAVISDVAASLAHHRAGSRLHLAAIDALVRIGSVYPVPAILRFIGEEWTQLEHSGNGLLMYALEVVRTLNSVLNGICEARPTEAIPVLARMRNIPPSARTEVIYAMARYGAGMEDVVFPPLLEALRDGDQGVRRSAAGALALLARAHDDAVRAGLSALLADAVPEICEACIHTLHQGDSVRYEAVRAALLPVLSHSSGRLRVAAAEALGHPACREDAHVIAALSNACNDPVYDVRVAAVAALGRIGTARPEVVNLLAEALAEEKNLRPVRIEAARALAAVAQGNPDGGRRLTKLCMSAIRDRFPEVRAAAARALGQLGAERPDLVGRALSGCLDDPSPLVRVAAARALSMIDLPHVERLIPKLRSASVGGTPADHMAVQDILDRFPAAGHLPDVNVLVGALADGNPEVRSAAVRTLRRCIQEVPQDVLAKLARMLCGLKPVIPEKALMSDEDRAALTSLFINDVERLIVQMLPIIYEADDYLEDRLDYRHGVAMRVLKPLYAAQPERVVQALIQALDVKTHGWRLRMAAAQALIALGNPQPLLSAAALLWAFSSEYSAYLSAAEKKRQNEEGRRIGATARNHSEMELLLRLKAAKLLAAFGAAQSAQLVAAMAGVLRDPGEPPRIRAAAAQALGEGALSVSEQNVAVLLQ